MTVLTTDKEKLVQEAEIRSNLYRVFASFFLLPPSEEFLSALSSSPIVEFSVDSSWKVTELHQEFHSLFLVPTEGCVFPYESCYRDRQGDRPGRLMGKAALEVQELYRRAGFTLAAEASELPDHAGLEFSFLQVLAEKEAAAWREGAEEQAWRWRHLHTEFLNAHPVQWLPALCDEISAKTAHTYFNCFARWISGVVDRLDTAEDHCILPSPKLPEELHHAVE